MKWMTSFLILLMTLIVSGQGSEVDDHFAKANQAYTAENYQMAISNYEEILKTDVHSVDVYYNLGNSYYKLNQVGPAIYNYEKALMLDPSNEDVLNNLQFAKQMRIDAVESLPENEFESKASSVASSLTIDEWAYLSIILLIISILLFVLYHYSQTAGKKRLFFLLMLLFAIGVITTIIIGFYAQNNLDNQQYAIVYAVEFTAREEPKQSSSASFVIHEGTKVEVLEEFNDWARISLENGSKAWVTLETIKKL
ncbi:tetratricopeptide repeat protein [Nonlabens sp. Asnod3-H03]|uniref:SH3 domain-containing protein n=1 Tax=Nonlabens sp. Asnod3-H03 TaxID=3160580 RepID=UPI00386D29B6